jgi:hypothetical protein
MYAANIALRLGAIALFSLGIASCKSREERAHDEATRGRSALDSANYPAAEKAFRQALEAQPDLPEAVAGLALLAARQGAPEKGLHEIRDCKSSVCTEAREQIARQLLHDRVRAGFDAQEVLKLADLAESDTACGLLDVLREVKATRKGDAPAAGPLVDAVRQAIQTRFGPSVPLDGARLMSTMAVAMSFAGLGDAETCEQVEAVRRKVQETYVTLAASFDGGVLPLVPPQEQQRRMAVGLLALEQVFPRATGSPLYPGDAGDDVEDDERDGGKKVRRVR